MKTDQKLFLLYLTDSIVKNVKGNYIPIFEKSIVANFEDAFKSNVSNSVLLKELKLIHKRKIPTFVKRCFFCEDPGSLYFAMGCSSGLIVEYEWST